MKNAGTLKLTTPTDPRDRDDARLRRAAPPGLRRLHQARTGQAVAARAAGLDDAGLRNRSEGGAAPIATCGVTPKGKEMGDGRHLPRDRAA